MKRKLLVLALTAALAASLGGCGSEETQSAESADSHAAQEEQLEDSTEDAVEEETISIDPEKDHEIATSREVLAEDNQVFYEDEWVRLTYTGLVEDFMGQNLRIKAENLSDRQIHIWSEYISINGVMVGDTMSFDLDAGETQEEEKSIYGLSANGIEKMGTVTLRLEIRDAESNEELKVADDVSLVVDDSVANETPEETGELVYEDHGIRISYLSQDGDETETEYHFLLENQNDVVAIVYAKEIYLDGVHYEDAYMVSEMLPGTISYDEVRDADLSYPNDAKTMEVVFKIEDADNSEDYLVTEKISIPLA